MAFKYVHEYEGASEADAIREWCRGKIERLRGELRLIRGKQLIGKGSRQRHLDFERLAGQIDSLEILLETKFIEEDKVTDTWNCPICKQESSGMVNDDG